MVHNKWKKQSIMQQRIKGSGQDRTGQDRTGQDRTGQDRTGQEEREAMMDE